MKKQPKPPNRVRTVSCWIRGIPSSDKPRTPFLVVDVYATKAAAKAQQCDGEVLVHLHGVYARLSR